MKHLRSVTAIKKVAARYRTIFVSSIVSWLFSFFWMKKSRFDKILVSC